MSDESQPNSDEFIFVHKDPPLLPEATTHEQKQENWNIMKAFFSEMTDPTGRHIEPRIIDAVTALNLLGISTDSSCEGHRNEFSLEEFNAPNVRIEPPFPPGFEEEAEQAFELEDRLREEYEGSPKPNRELYEKWNQAAERSEPLGDKMSAIANAEASRVQKLLDEFYEETPETATNSQTQLIISEESGYSPHIISKGGKSINLLPPDERPVILKELQTEMARFTDFLKKKCLEGK